MLIKVKKNLGLLLFVTLSPFLMGAIYSTSSQNLPENSFTIMEMHDAAWILKKGQGVRKTATVGDILRETDELEVLGRNWVVLAMNGDEKNVMHIEGGSALSVQSGEVMRVDLRKGRLTALLDDLKGVESFRVTTPTAVAAVRGTWFQVNALASRAEILTFEGKVQVSGRRTNGRTGFVNTFVHPGQFSVVEGLNVFPSEAHVMTSSDYKQIVNINERLDLKRQLKQYDTLVAETVKGVMKKGASAEPQAVSSFEINQGNTRTRILSHAGVILI